MIITDSETRGRNWRNTVRYVFSYKTDISLNLVIFRATVVPLQTKLGAHSPDYDVDRALIG